MMRSHRFRPGYILSLALLFTLLTSSCSNPTPENITQDNAPPVENFPALIGWEGDKDGVIAYYDGSFFVRNDKNQRYHFGIFNNPGSFKWYNCEGYLPCLVTEFEREGASIKITNFGDQVMLNSHSYVIIYSRVAVTNPKNSDIFLDPAPSAGIVSLVQNESEVPPNLSVVHDYAVAADRFGKLYAWPSDADLASAGSWDEHYAHMKEYWNSRLGEIVNITRLPDERLINAYKAGFIYTHIVRDGNDLHVGENGYDQVFDHDSVGILTTLFGLGDFSNAQALLGSLQAQTQYQDARYKNSWVWALYLLKTGDEDFVNQHFVGIKSNTHQIEAARSGPGGILEMTDDIDARGYWTVDDASALFGLTTYQYLADRLGYADEAAWAKNLYGQLLSSVNTRLEQTMQENNVDYLPCDLTQPNTANRCDNPQDANWASMLLFGRWYWDGYLWGEEQTGPFLDKVDTTYTYGFDRLQGVLPPHTYGAYPGYSTGYNAGYGRSGLRGTHYRTEAILDYQFMLDNTQSSPFGWWENIAPPKQISWEGTHPAGGQGACPHMWGQSFATAGLLDSLIVEKSDGTVLVGRGVPNEWVAQGQVIELSNYPISGGKRMGMRIEGLPQDQVRLTLRGDKPAGAVVFNLPALIGHTQSSTGGIINNPAGEVTLDANTRSVTVTITR